MPKYADIRGHRVVIHSDEHNPPHVHVEGPDEWAKIEISGGTVKAGKISGKLLKDVRKFLAENKDLLLAEWTRIMEEEEDGGDQ